jgi:hypothetical protein
METKPTPPTKDEIIAIIKEQIEVKKVQVELQQLNTQFAQLRLEELKAITISAQITNPQPENNISEEDGIPHRITQDDLDNNPDLIEQGIKVGDEVLLENPVSEKKESSSKRGLKKS